jgi:hypothetical protein
MPAKRTAVDEIVDRLVLDAAEAQVLAKDQRHTADMQHQTANRLAELSKKIKTEAITLQSATEQAILDGVLVR